MARRLPEWWPRHLRSSRLRMTTSRPSAWEAWARMRPATWIRAYGPLAVPGAPGGASGPFAHVAVETWGTRVRGRPPDGACGVSAA